MLINFKTTHFLIRHQEISLKGGNRVHFERRLITHVTRVLGKHPTLASAVQNHSGRLLVPLKVSVTTEAHAELLKLVEDLTAIGGITAITPCIEVERNFDAMLTHAREWLSNVQRQNIDVKTFRIRSRRVDKTFEIPSAELDRRIGSALATEFPALQPNLANADVELRIEIRQKHILMYGNETSGMRGLPIDPNQRVLCLLSGGIDSPVAAYQAMRRGCTPLFVHFHSKPFTSEASIEKAKKLAVTLRKYSTLPLELWLVPMLDIQQAVRDTCSERLRTIHYRRFMLRLAEELAQRQGAKALVTGDVIGQVASQTLTNLAAMDDPIRMPILRPLISLDKQDIIAQARTLGTYEISLIPHDDTCSLFAPSKPTVQAHLTTLDQEQARMPGYEMIFKALDSAERVVI